MSLELVERRIATLHVIGEILSSMRALSALQYRRGTETLAQLRAFSAELRTAIATLNAPVLAPPTPRHVVLCVLGTDQGLCGPLSVELAHAAVQRIERLAERAAGVFAVGRRTLDALPAPTVNVLGGLPAAASLRGVDGVVDQVAAKIEALVRDGLCDGVEVVYSEHDEAGRSRPHVSRVFPVYRSRLVGDLEPTAYPPRLFEPSNDVAQAVLREWTYAEIYRSAVESLTSEYGARLRTTDGATRTLERRVGDLRLELNHLRQEAITQEMQELMAGSEASGPAGSKFE